MMFGLSRTAARIALAVITVVLLIGVLQVRSCVNAKREAATLRVQGEQLKAGANSAADAIATQGQVNQREREGDDLTRANEKEIRDAPGADARVDDRATAAGLDSLCRRPLYRDTERCRLRAAPPQ